MSNALATILNSRMASLQRELLYVGLGWLRVSERKIKRHRRDLILLYHAVETKRSGYLFSVSQRSLERQIRFLRRYFKLVSLEELFNQPAEGSRIALTFDDAFEDFYTNAYPLLQKYRVPATVFVPTRYIGQEPDQLHNQLFDCAKGHVTWEQIGEMQASGLVTFESHTHTHRNAVEHIHELRQDVLCSVELLEQKTGYRSRYFAYPYGACNAETHAIVLGCGFERLLTVAPCAVAGQVAEGRFDVNRSNESLSRFKLLVAEIYLE